MIKKKHFLIPALYCLLLIVAGKSSAAQESDSSSKAGLQHTGFISSRAVMIIKWETSTNKLLDSLTWTKQPLLLQKYGGRKIKNILLQKSTNRVVVFAAGDKVAWMNKDSAIAIGLIAMEKTSSAAIKKTASSQVFNKYISTPVYIDTINRFILPDDHIPVSPENDNIRPTGNPSEYFISAHQPGSVNVLMKDTITGQRTLFYFTAERLPSDKPAGDPTVQFGNITTQTTTIENLRLQHDIIVSDGFKLAGANMYFSGTGFRAVPVVTLTDRLGDAQYFLEICLPGSTIIFDNVRVKDASNNIYDIPDIVINVVDSSYADNPSIDYFTLGTVADFKGGDLALDAYLRKKLKVRSSDNIPSGNQQVSMLLKISPDGKPGSATAMQLLTMDPLNKKCYDIILKGPAWKPATFNGKAIESVAGYFTTIDVSVR